MQLSFLSKLFAPKKPKAVPRTRSAPRAISDPFLLAIWLETRQRFFPDRLDLDAITITWSSRRQKRVLASVSIHKKAVRVASELNYPDHHRWLSPLIYHEMCHAVLGETVAVKNRKRQWHGADFKKLEQQHPEMAIFEEWVKSGGWSTAVRSARTRMMWKKRAAR